ncbi:MAG: SpoVA/SpoVAEb family sporulation membrane protein [Clostridia bacterium]|nr:SpoVA/SpoVAEb family sporulation membrane protein [Clostridia bacterium]MBR2472325.1 SpoVA/SpoVAEb family sporulation membrane protein [Clostridia bacterium]
MMYIKAFLIGGLICAVSQLLIDRTRLTPARILSSYVVIGLVLTAIGIYEPFAKWAGAGATVPILGFGYTMAKGVQTAVAENGFLGALSGGLTAAAAGVSVVVALSFVCSWIFKGGDRS